MSDAEWDKGFDDGFANAKQNAQVTNVFYYEKGGKKFYNGSSSGTRGNYPSNFKHRGSMYDRGYGEGMISGASARFDELIPEICKANGIEYVRYPIKTK